jgi:hypothetical protein
MTANAAGRFVVSVRLVVVSVAAATGPSVVALSYASPIVHGRNGPVRFRTTVNVDPAGTDATRNGVHEAGAPLPGAANTTTGSVLEVFVHETVAAVTRTLLMVTPVIVGRLVSTTDVHAVHADGRRPACSDRARTHTRWPELVNGGNAIPLVGICPGA